MENFKQSVFELISETSANLPPDVRRAISRAMKDETPDTQAALALSTIAINIDMAQQAIAPICQDTGMPTFFTHRWAPIKSK
jgi:fumarate hydratase class I